MLPRIQLFAAMTLLSGAVWAAEPQAKTASGPAGVQETMAGRAVTLKGTSSAAGPEVEAVWDFGDGSAPARMRILDGYDVSARHAYKGEEGMEYAAILTVTDLRTGEKAVARHTVAVRTASLAVEAGIALEEGLWYLHRTMRRERRGEQVVGDWRGECGRACSGDGSANASNVLAFEAAGYLATGDERHPYTETVARALAGLLEEANDPAVKTEDWLRAIEYAETPDREAEHGPAEIRGKTFRAIAARALAAEGAPEGAREWRRALERLSPAAARALVETQSAEGYWAEAAGGKNAIATARAVTGLSSTFRATASTILNVSSLVQVTTTGYLYSRAQATFNGTLTVRNISASAISGPLQVVLTALTAGVTLANAEGTLYGAPYIVIPGVTTLAPGATASVQVRFSNPSNKIINFTPVTYSGTFPPAPVSVDCPVATATNGVSYSSALGGNGGVQPCTFSISPGSLPTGLTLDPSTGAITGTPTGTGLSSFTANLADGSRQAGGVASASCSINVASSSVAVTVQTAPSGLSYTFDGGSYSSTQIFNVTPGSQYGLATTSPQGSGGTQYVFQSWSDAGAISHTITAPGTAATYTATFGTEHQLTTAASPSAGGTVTSASGFHAAGSVQNVSATPNSGYVFNGWTGPVANAALAATTVTMSGPVGVTANFAVALSLACQTETSGFVGTAFSSSVTASGGAATYSYSVSGGALPNGLTMSPSTGLISGTPSTKGNFSFTAQVTDQTSPFQQTATANCSITVANRAPTATAQSTSTNEDTSKVVTLAGTDPDGDALTFAIVTNPVHGSLGSFGSVSCSGTPSNCTRNVTYTPAANYNGPDSFTFKVNDGTTDSAANATVTITVNAVNDPPAAAVKAYSAQANMRIVIPAVSGLLAGATDPDSGDSGFTSAFTVGTVSATSPAGGAVNVNTATGNFTFDPPPGVTGNVTFTYTVCDNGNPMPSQCSAAATVTVTIAAPVIWFVNPVAAGGGNGTLQTPFNTLAAATAAMGSTTGQYIFVYSGKTASGSGVTLPASGRLIGQGVAGASFDSVMGIAPPVTTIVRPFIGGTAPIIQGTVSMNGSDTQVRGLRIQPPASSAGLQATLSGPFTNLLVSDVPNITTSSARAVNLNNVSGTFTIGAVSASSADIGLNLSSVNASGGSFTVAGTGGTCTAATTTCTGGTISNATDSGVKLTSASNVTLTRMRMNGSANFGLSGSSVTGLTLDTCVFDGVHGNALNEGAIYVTNWLGTGAITNSEILGGWTNNVQVENNTGVLNRLTITNSIIRNTNAASPGNHGLRFATNVAAAAGSGVVMNLTVTGSLFRNNRSNHFDSGARGLTAMDIVLSNNTFLTSGFTTLGGAVNTTVSNSADVTFNYSSNNSTGAVLSAFNFFGSNTTTAGASMIGRFQNNTIGTANVAGSGSSTGDGVAFTMNGLGTLTTNVTNNTVRGIGGDYGILFTAGDTSPVVNATVTGNSVKEGRATSPSGLQAIYFNVGTTATGAVAACADIGGAGTLRNDVSGFVSGIAEIRVRQRFSSTFQLPGLTGAVDAFLVGRNTVTGTSSVAYTGTFGNNGSALCPQAP